MRDEEAESARVAAGNGRPSLNDAKHHKEKLGRRRCKAMMSAVGGMDARCEETGTPWAQQVMRRQNPVTGRCADAEWRDVSASGMPWRSPGGGSMADHRAWRRRDGDRQGERVACPVQTRLAILRRYSAQSHRHATLASTAPAPLPTHTLPGPGPRSHVHTLHDHAHPPPPQTPCPLLPVGMMPVSLPRPPRQHQRPSPARTPGTPRCRPPPTRLRARSRPYPLATPPCRSHAGTRPAAAVRP